MKLWPINDPDRQRQALALLSEGFQENRSFWEHAFHSSGGRLGHGLLLAGDCQDAEGVLLLFECVRRVAGKDRRVVNLSSWYVRPTRRADALDMMCEATADRTVVYTNFSPLRSVEKLMLALGFRYVSRGAYLSVPGLNGWRGGSVTCEKISEASAGALPAPVRLPARHIGVRLRWRNQMAEAVFRVISRRGRRVGRLAYCSDHALLRRGLPRLHWHLLLRHGLAAIFLPVLPAYAGLRTLRDVRHGPVSMVRGDIPDEQVDLLQSEYYHLPLSA